MKILITGGAGYIGTAVIKLLVNCQQVSEIKVLDRFPEGTTYLNSFLKSKKISLIKGDIRNIDLLKKILLKVDVVCHLAAIVGFPACDANPYEALSINTDATKNLCSLLSNDQKIIFSSTGSTYGKVEGFCTENTPINPLTLYGRSKAEAEKYILNSGGINLRLATLYGISNKSRDDLLINNMCRDAVKNKCITLFQRNAYRSFLEVNDAAKFFKHAILGNLGFNDTFNIGDEKLNYKKHEIVSKIANITKCKVFEDDYWSDPDQRDYIVDYSKLKSLNLSININSSIDEDLLGIINYYKIN